MKRKEVFLYALVAAFCSICLFSCQKPDQPKTDPDSSFVVSSRLVSVPVEGGAFNFEYTISGPKEGNTATVVSDADWIHVGKVFSTTFSYRVDKNETGTDREGVVTMTCDGVKTLKITVTQSRKKQDKPIFSRYELIVDNVTTSSAHFVITPVDAAQTYLWSVVRKSDYDAMTPKSYMEKRISQIKENMIMYPGTTFRNYLSAGPVDTDNLPLEQRPSFNDRTEYYLTAFDLSFDENTGEPSYSGEIDKVYFMSASASPSPMKFTIESSGNFVNVKADGSDTFICDVLTSESWNEFSNPDDAAHLYVTYRKGYNQFETFKGSHQIDLEKEDCVKDTKYVVFAVGYRDTADDGGLTTQVQFIEFIY